MLKKNSAIVAAAVTAGLIVTFVPGFAPAVEAHPSQADDQSTMTTSRALAGPGVIEQSAAAAAAATSIHKVEELIRNGSRTPKVICAQSWPNYGPDCLRGDRATENPRAVRVIALERSRR